MSQWSFFYFSLNTHFAEMLNSGTIRNLTAIKLSFYCLLDLLSFSRIYISLASRLLRPFRPFGTWRRQCTIGSSRPFFLKYFFSYKVSVWSLSQWASILTFHLLAKKPVLFNFVLNFVVWYLLALDFLTNQPFFRLIKTSPHIPISCWVWKWSRKLFFEIILIKS